MIAPTIKNVSFTKGHFFAALMVYLCEGAESTAVDQSQRDVL